MSGTPDFGSKVFAAWREAAGPAWPAYTGHAFVRGLGDGTLPREAFLHYLKQDYIFLFHFARAWALAVVKAIQAAIGPQVHRVQPFAHSNTTAPAIPRFNTTTHYLTLMGRVNQDAHCSASRPAASLVV